MNIILLNQTFPDFLMLVHVGEGGTICQGHLPQDPIVQDEIGMLDW